MMTPLRCCHIGSRSWPRSQSSFHRASLATSCVALSADSPGELRAIPRCRDPKSCDRRIPARMRASFSRGRSMRDPSGLADHPRPFVFRSHHLDGLTVAAGALFHFDLHLFEVRQPLLVHFVESLKRLAEEGSGHPRARPGGSGRAARTGRSARCLGPAPIRN